MNRFPLNISLSLLVIQVLAWSAIVANQGFSTTLTFWMGIATLAMAGIVAWTLRPLSGLARASEAILKSVGASVPARPLEKIAAAMQQRDRQFDRQSQQLAENRERFDAVLSGMIEGVIAIDDAGNVLFANRAAREILSISSLHVVGRPLVGLVRYEEVQRAVNQAVRTQRTVVSHFQTIGPDRRQVTMRVAPMAGDPMPGMTLVFRDVTEIHRLENMRRDFVANVSHELKTPLSSIKAYAETLRLGAISESPINMQFVSQIEAQANLLEQQIHDLLQLARVESGQAVMRLERVDAAKVCRDAIQKLAVEADQRNVQVHFETDQNIPTIQVDGDALHTIVENLISNAIRYTQPSGAVRVKIRSTGKQVQVEVIDNGIGIAPENQQRVFERFYRVDKARSRDLGGTGLGLAIVKHLTQSLDGRVELESKIGAGSTFRVCFPLPQETRAATGEEGDK